ncbi:hypothetical protein P8C59_003774 [Phyllachora maydis]|uniref:nicotinamidase n=1 Tax=Phyllachora maydis TaxID=1825666 RepID=A0AAD9I275_9PEZI|nr:hypothetical protein P8C59_003774 [Phyllachora maydis]
MADQDFKAALLVVDVQEDFCPPNGALAVPDGRSILPTINALLALPFAVKLATKDWHPTDHISFAANHAGKRAFVDSVTVANPHKPEEQYTSRLWPVHCVQHTGGAALAAGLDTARLDGVVLKGTDARVEMYSAFYAPLGRPRVGDSGLAAALREARVSHVYVVGLAADYCVSATALDAAAEGFDTVVVAEGTRPVDARAWEATRREMLRRGGVRVVGCDGPEVRRVRQLAGPEEEEEEEEEVVVEEE